MLNIERRPLNVVSIQFLTILCGKSRGSEGRRKEGKRRRSVFLSVPYMRADAKSVNVNVVIAGSCAQKHLKEIN